MTDKLPEHHSASVDSASVETFGYRQELKRSLSMFELLVYGLVFIAPLAPLSTFGIVYNASGGMVPLVYLIGMVAMLVTAASYMSMSRVFPIAGSVYAYAGRAIGERTGFFAGWVMLLDYLLLPTLIYVLCAIAIHSVFPDVPRLAWIVLFLAGNTVVSLFGIQTTARMGMIFLALQFGSLAILLIAAAVAAVHGTSGAQMSMLPFFNADTFALPAIFAALSLAVLSFLGFDAISTLAEEAKGGPSAVGTATILSLLVVSAIFMISTYALSLFVLGHVNFAPGEATDAAFYNIAATIGGPWLKVLFAGPAVFFTGLPGALVAQVATTRLLFSMARDGRLPRWLAVVNPKRQVPERATLLVSAATLVLGVIFAQRLSLLTSMVNFGALVGFFLLHVSVIAYFVWRNPDGRWIRHLLLPSLGLIIIGYVLVNLDSNAKLAGLCWLAIGAVALGLSKNTRAPRAS